jgi:acetolactate synthase-1/2/3 large subunit
MSYLMSFLGMVRQWQQLFFDKRYFYWDDQPNFVAIAELLYQKKKVIKREDLDAAVAEMMASKDSYLLSSYGRK